MVRTLSLRIAALLLALAALPLVIEATARAQEGDGAPQIISQNLNEGDVLGEPPHVVQFCFGRPVTAVRSGEDYAFTMKTPEGQSAPDRTVFQRNRLGVAIYPGDPPARPSVIPTAEEPIWTFEWMVTDAETGETAEGVISFTIEEGADVIPNEDAPPCAPLGSPVGGIRTATPSPVDGNGSEDGGDDDDDNGWLLVVLVVAGIVAGLSAIATVGLFIVRARVRRRSAGAADDLPDGDV